MSGFDHQSGHHLPVDGAQIYYEAHGHLDDPALILLHGGLGTLAEFDACVPLLEKLFRVIGVDSRGHGKSTLGPPERLSYAQLQHDVERVAEHLGLASYSVIGFSDGGCVALRMAASARSKIEKLVVVGTRAEIEDSNRALFGKVTAESWRNKFPDTYERYQKLNPTPDFDTLVSSVVKMWLDESESGYPGRAIEKIRCDTLVARGDEDHLVSRDSAFSLVSTIPRAKLLNIPFSGHSLHEEQPELMMRSVNRFLRE